MHIMEARRNHEIVAGQVTDPTDPYCLYNRDEAAAFLRVHRGTLSRMTTEGAIYSVRIGRRVMYPRAALERYIRGDGPDMAEHDWNTGTLSVFQQENTCS